MKFTLVFPSNEASDLSIGAIFVPCLVWTLGKTHFLKPHSENPHYLPGDFQDLVIKLSQKSGINFSIKENLGHKLFVIVHEVGHGTDTYLKDLLVDIEEVGFLPILCR
jgi:hypothetical protein